MGDKISGLEKERQDGILAMKNSQMQLSQFRGQVGDLSSTLRAIRKRAQDFKSQNKHLVNELGQRQNEVKDLNDKLQQEQLKLQEERQQNEKEFNQLSSQLNSQLAETSQKLQQVTGELEREIDVTKNLEGAIAGAQNEIQIQKQQVADWQQRAQMIEA